MKDKFEGYDTKEPCDRCGAKPAKIEPRFGYTRCKECANIPPVHFFNDEYLIIL